MPADVDDATFERLLNREESETLDFKEGQYKFVNASEKEKSELLKDILAMANAWKESDAYILRGVKDVKGQRAEVTGITDDLDDASLQQFVHSNTTERIAFNYETKSVDGLKVGIFRIDKSQRRPIAPAKDYGKLKAGRVYIRRSSSTDEADGAEVARMVRADAAVGRQPQVEIGWGEQETRRLLGSEIKVVSKLVKERHPPRAPSSNSLGGRYASGRFRTQLDQALSSHPTRRHDVEYEQEVGLLCPLRFAARNVGAVLIEGFRVVAMIPNKLGLLVLDALPPRYEFLATLHDRPVSDDVSVRVEAVGDYWEVNAYIGKVQPRAIEFSDKFWVGSRIEQDFQMEATILGDNIRDDTPHLLRIEITTKEVWLAADPKEE